MKRYTIDVTATRTYRFEVSGKDEHDACYNANKLYKSEKEMGDVEDYLYNAEITQEVVAD